MVDPQKKTKDQTRKGVPVIGLFTGAGGLEIGAVYAGADVRLCVDNDAIACQTLRQNPDIHSGIVLEADVAEDEASGIDRADQCERGDEQYRQGQQREDQRYAAPAIAGRANEVK